MILAAIGILFALITLFVLGACRVAGRSDEITTEAYYKMKADE